MPTLKDHQQEAISRLITQYKESETLKDYLRAVLALANELEQVFCDLLLNRFIDTAEGTVLDIIGTLVGQPRILVDAANIPFFGFDEDPTAEEFSSLADPESGGRFRSFSETTTGNITLTDEDYRIFIRARIIKNNTRATRENIIEMIIFVLDAEEVEIIEGDRSYRVNIGRDLTDSERALIISTDLLPKPAGIGVGYTFFDPSEYTFTFGDIGDTDNENGFSSVAAPTVGGEFSTLV